VYSSDGREVGTLHAIVVDPRDNEVTHVAVNAGPHFPQTGFGDPKIVSVDFDRLKSATADRADLALTQAEFDALPPYEHRHFYEVPPEEEEAPPPEAAEEDKGLSRWWNTGIAIGASLATLGSGIAVPAEHFQKAGFERHILNDAPVWRTEPNTHIGDVESVIVNEETDEIEALVIRRGALFHEEVTLPMRYVTEIRDGVIHAQLTDAELEGLERADP
jgi:sporulation protein YlmC with PRC-barrel domain